MLANRNQKRPQAAKTRAARLGMDFLEDRLAPAVTASFDPLVGTLQVTIDDDNSTGQDVSIAASSGWTRVVSGRSVVPINTPLGTVKIPAKTIRSISINGSSLDNRINLTGVSAKTFLHLDGPVEIWGGAGSDTVIGSQLNDRIWGDDGNDLLSGLGGNDWLIGGAGQDDINGYEGDDYIAANDGEPDIINGGRGENTDTSDSLDNLSNFLPHGLRGDYFADSAFDALGATRIDPTINFKWGQDPPYVGDPMPNKWTDNLNQTWYVHYTVRWLGRVVPNYSETYTFHLTVDDGAMLWVNDRLIINAWKDQGPTEYSGQIALTAGEPARIKLLYYNAWFSATVKLAWSSPSQPKQIIPAAQLIAPEREAPASTASAPSLAGRISTETIALPGPVNYAPRGGWGDRPNTVVAPLANGGYKLGWNDTNGTAHITTLNSALQVTGEITLQNLDLRGMVAHNDGYVGVMAARNSYQMVVLRLDPRGDRVFETVLTGLNPDPTQGTHLDTLWCYRGRFITTGTQYAVHFAHIQQQGHQGGYYAVLDFTGKKVVENGWTVSHSLDQRLLFHKGQFFSMSLGDVYPKGFHFENRTLGRGKVIYPAKDQIGQWNPESANLGSMVSAGRNIGLVIASKDGASKDLVYLLVDTEGRILRSVPLTHTSSINESSVRLIPYGKNLLVAWQENPNQTKVAVINYDGKFLNKPVVVNQPLPGNDELVTFPNGDVGWIAAKQNESTMSLVRIRLF
jgi:hypothetical protein